MSEDRAAREALGGCVIAFTGVGLMLIGTVYSAFVVSKLWSWFVVPQTGWHALNTATVYGLLLLYSAVTYKHPKSVESSDWAGWKMAGMRFGADTLILVLGYCALHVN